MQIAPKMNVRLRGFKLWWILPAAFWLIQTVFAVEVGEVYQADGDQKFEIIEKLGQGSFGEVWKVKDPQSKRIYAVKFFSKGELDPRVAQIYRDIADLQNQGELSGLIRVFAPQDLWLNAKGERQPVTVVRFEIASSNLEARQQIQYSFLGTTSTDALVKKIVRVRRLLDEGVGALQQLRKYKINHHDLNPRNILQVTTDTFKFGDLDGIRPYGEPPPEQAWEGYLAPIEYSAVAYGYEDENLSDAFQFANTIYKLIFENYPLALLQSAANVDDIWKLRRQLAGYEQARKGYDTFVKSSLAARKREILAKLGSGREDARQDLLHIFDFLERALKIDVQERAQALTPFWGQIDPLPEPATFKLVAEPPSGQSISLANRASMRVWGIRMIATLLLTSSLHARVFSELSSSLPRPLQELINVWGALGGIIYGIHVTTNLVQVNPQSHLDFCRAAFAQLPTSAHHMYWVKGLKPLMKRIKGYRK